MADLYRTKVEDLAAALQREDTRLEASEMLRGLIDAIVLMPEKGQLRIVAERQAARDVDCRPKNKKVARNGRPSRAGTIGCGGAQPAVLAAVERGRVSSMHGRVLAERAATAMALTQGHRAGAAQSGTDLAERRVASAPSCARLTAAGTVRRN